MCMGGGAVPGYDAAVRRHQMLRELMWFGLAMVIAIPLLMLAFRFMY